MAQGDGIDDGAVVAPQQGVQRSSRASKAGVELLEVPLLRADGRPRVPRPSPASW
ncbi:MULTISPECIES: hypothetical protein [unclassified Streptomyces]|uniref:hypothetical protein n=1 Tax=unclassified Streptomyces TaxID=2593676 RepID=UPI00037F615B|nr:MULTISPECIES: hypothetical protein [unclassified Streptomyces]MYX36939.1 hypothetical protein [Streptomyces sp. SID8377]